MADSSSVITVPGVSGAAEPAAPFFDLREPVIYPYSLTPLTVGTPSVCHKNSHLHLSHCDDSSSPAKWRLLSIEIRTAGTKIDLIRNIPCTPPLSMGAELTPPPTDP